MMENLIISRYVILFEYNGVYLLYNSKNNLFLELNSDLFQDLQRAQNKQSDEIFQNEKIVDSLKKQEVICRKEDDDFFFDNIVLNDITSAFTNDAVSLTLAPTIWCNLKCPYCYETNKYKGVITKDICDKIVKFVKNNGNSRLYLEWYGGEPLLAIDRIEYFLDAIKEAGIKLLTHEMVTNGTLLKGKALDVFERYPLDEIQITIDGLKADHDKIRIHHNGAGTYDEILKNIDAFVQKFPETVLKLRINTGKHNAKNFMEVRDIMKDRYGSKAKFLDVYPGIIVGDNDCGFTSNMFSNSELADFYSLLVKKNVMPHLPEPYSKGCIATSPNGYVIGPRGEIYKCWSDIGFKEREIGSVVDNHFKNKKRYLQYLLHGSFRDDKTCQECSLLPLCAGGCPHRRLENRFEGKEKSLCVPYKMNDNQSLKDMLYLYYMEKKKQETITNE